MSESDTTAVELPDTPQDEGGERASIPQRLLWLMRPLGGVLIVLWIISPGTADRAEWQQQVAWAFLLGAFYALFIFWTDFYSVIQRIGKVIGK